MDNIVIHQLPFSITQGVSPGTHPTKTASPSNSPAKSVSSTRPPRNLYVKRHAKLHTKPLTKHYVKLPINITGQVFPVKLFKSCQVYFCKTKITVEEEKGRRMRNSYHSVFRWGYTGYRKLVVIAFLCMGKKTWHTTICLTCTVTCNF